MLYNPFEIARRKQRAARAKSTFFISVIFSSISAALGYFFSKKENRQKTAEEASKIAKNIHRATTDAGKNLYDNTSGIRRDAEKFGGDLKDAASKAGKNLQNQVSKFTSNSEDIMDEGKENIASALDQASDATRDSKK